jgi:alkanesulfonate monooxygenase SsuD/methylene tetrahydromethanopterin reductase-like flavin-dependent oxidoreductase (luciferase family)
VEFGIHVQAVADGADVSELGRLAEEHGFESLFVPEHTHTPGDILSRGRFLFGIGAGWIDAALVHHGGDPRAGGSRSRSGSTP